MGKRKERAARPLWMKKALALLAVVLAAELLVGNYSAFRSMGYQESDLTESLTLEGAVPAETGGTAGTDGGAKPGDAAGAGAARGAEQEEAAVAGQGLEPARYVSPTGSFTLAAEGLDCEAGNLYLGLELPDGAVVSYTVSLTDEGNYYAYSLPTQKLAEWLPSTGYTNLYPYGRVHSLNIQVEGEPGMEFSLEKLGINVPRPFRIQPVRVLLLLGLGSLLLAFGEKSRLYGIPFRPGSRGQRAVTAGAVLALLAFGWFLVRANSACVESPWPHHQQYRLLAEAVSQGHVWVDAQQARILEGVANPYDTSYLLANQIPYWADYAYLDGKYYVYFGIVPELLFFLPCFLLLGKGFPNYLAVYFFYAGFVIAVFGLYREAVKRWFDDIPLIIYLLAGVATVTFGSYIYLIVRPDLYHIPMMGANMFTAAGLWLWLWGLNRQKGRKLLWAAGSLSMALVAGCRPQMLLFSVLAIPLLWREIFGEKGHIGTRLKERWRELLALGLPYVIVAAGIMYYNALRFGSPFDFGAAYSLTNNDMTKRGTNLSRIAYGIYCFFFQPGRVEGAFPFLFSSGLENNYMGKMVSEFLFGGIFVSQAFTWSLLFYGKLRGAFQKKGIGVLALTSLITAVVIGGFDANGAGVLQRYMSDQVFGAAFASMLMLFLLVQTFRGTKGWGYVTVYIRAALALHAAYAFLMIFACGDSVNLMNYGQRLYYGAAELFRF